MKDTWLGVRRILSLIMIVGFLVMAVHAAVYDNYPKATFFLLLVWFAEWKDVWQTRKVGMMAGVAHEKAEEQESGSRV